jgi:alpha-beta hydrolase superfamily lysophospholipase
MPTYVIHGSEDPIVPADASAPLARDPHVTRRVYAGLRHETHNEPEGPTVVADTIAWIRANA